MYVVQHIHSGKLLRAQRMTDGVTEISFHPTCGSLWSDENGAREFLATRTDTLRAAVRIVQHVSAASALFEKIKRDVCAIDVNLYSGDGVCVVSNSADPADDGRAARWSAFYETRDTLYAVHFYVLASGKTEGPFWSSKGQSIALGDIPNTRGGIAIRSACTAIRIALGGVK